jgi:hypothetical protein
MHRLPQRLGLDPERGKPCVLPIEAGSALGQISCIARRCSSVMAPRSANGTPSMADSATTQPAPIPRITRPALSTSIDATILAFTIRCDRG